MKEIMTSGEAAASIGIAVETLRYWEPAGPLDPVARDDDERRRYSPADLEFDNVIRCLRVTGMPVCQVRRIANLLRMGPASSSARLSLLQEHGNEVVNGSRVSSISPPVLY